MRGHWEGQIRLSAGNFLVHPAAGAAPVHGQVPASRDSCTDGVTRMINPALRAGTLDFAIKPARTDEIEIGMLAEVLFEREIVVVVAHESTRGHITRLAQVLQVPWVYASPSPGLGTVIESVSGRRS